MIRRVYLELKGDYDPRKVWALIECYGVNMLVAEDKSWIYGPVKLRDLGKLIQTCAYFGEVNTSVLGGGSNGQEEETQA